MNETKKRIYVERDGFLTEASLMLMGFAMVCCAVGSIGHWGDMNYLICQVALPIFSGLLFILCTALFGGRAFWTTVIPVVLGVVYFIFRAMGMENDMMKVAFIVADVVVVVLYTMTFSHVGLKWILALVLLAALGYHVAVLDAPALMERAETITFVGGMRELSILAVLLSMLCISLAMKLPSDKQPAEGEAPAETEDKKAKKDKKSKKGKKAAEEEKTEAPAEQSAAPAGEPAQTPTSAPAEEPAQTPVPAPAEEPAPAQPETPAPLGPIAVIETPSEGDGNAL